MKNCQSLLAKKNKQFNQYWKVVFEAMMIFVMKIGVMGTSQEFVLKNEGYYYAKVEERYNICIE